MIPKQLFTYWEGPKPAYIKFCIDTIVKNAGVKVILLNSENAEEYVQGALHPNYKKLKNIAQKVDCIRIALLYNHGGMWCDADTVFLRSCEHLFESTSDFIGMRWRNKCNILNGYFWSSPKSAFMSRCLDSINWELKYNPKAYYSTAEGVYFGEELFKRMMASLGNSVTIIKQETILPVSFPFDAKIWLRNEPISRFIKEETVAIGLNNSQFPPSIRRRNLKDLAIQKNLFGSALRCGGAIGQDGIESDAALMKDPPLPMLPVNEPEAAETVFRSPPSVYCGVIFYDDTPRMLGACLQAIAKNGIRIIAVDGAFREYLHANNVYRHASSGGCIEIAKRIASRFIPAKTGGWEDEVEKRNAYLKLVPTGNYCMWIDTDEILPRFSLPPLEADAYRITEILHKEDGGLLETPRLRLVKKYDDLVYKYQHCRMYRLSQHVEGDLSSGCVVRSSGSTNSRYPFLCDSAGVQIKFDHFPHKRPKERQEGKERFYKIRAESKLPY